jgi:hypothetical protein
MARPRASQRVSFHPSVWSERTPDFVLCLDRDQGVGSSTISTAQLHITKRKTKLISRSKTNPSYPNVKTIPELNPVRNHSKSLIRHIGSGARLSIMQKKELNFIIPLERCWGDLKVLVYSF